MWVARQEWFDLNVCLVGGADGLLVVDTQASGRAARADRRRRPRARGRPGDGGLQHPRALRPHLRQRRLPRGVRPGPDPRPRRGGGAHPRGGRAGQAAVRRRPRRPPSRRGPRDRDGAGRPHVLVRPRARPRRPPGGARPSRARPLLRRRRGAGSATPTCCSPATSSRRAPHRCTASDCHPLEWPGSLDVVLNLVGTDTVVVPGHGAVVDRGFVEEQRDAIAIVAQTDPRPGRVGRAGRPGAGRGRVAVPA